MMDTNEYYGKKFSPQYFNAWAILDKMAVRRKENRGGRIFLDDECWPTLTLVTVVVIISISGANSALAFIVDLRQHELSR